MLVFLLSSSVSGTMESITPTQPTHFTCTSCHIQFPSSNDQRSHMKSDWHRYNLKRRVAQLPPISETIFLSKVDTLSTEKQEQETSQEVTPKEARRLQKEALLEKKRQLLQLAKNRIGSNAGLVTMTEDGKLVIERSNAEEEQVREEVAEAVAKEAEEEVTEEDLIKQKMDNKIDVPNEWCIICMPSSTIKKLKLGENDQIEKDPKYQFESLDKCYEHLFQHHNLYIPESKYLTDKSGLLSYLYEKLSFGNVCLSCNYQGKNLEAVKHHMVSKRHIRIPFENEDERLEYGSFYDFSSTWDQAVSGDEGEEGEWEDVSSDDDENAESDLVTQDQLLATDSGLYLPNGKMLGHRSLMRYYKQNLPEPKEVSEGQGTVMAAETRRGLSNMLVDKEQLKQDKRTWKRENKSRDRDDRRAAKFINWQEHYRDQLLQ